MREGSVRIAVFGVGRLGASHAATLATLPGVTSLTVFEADAARAKDVAAPLKAKAVTRIAEVAGRSWRERRSVATAEIA